VTYESLVSLVHAVKRSHWNAEVGVRMFLRTAEETPEVYGYAIGVGRNPFPNIKGRKEGPFPVYPSRPFYDARLWESDEQRAWEEECDS
jgi:hypothetical protein